MVSLYIGLALAEIMATDLPNYIGGYHLDIACPFLVILMNILSVPCKTWEYLIIIYIQLIFGCLNNNTWEVITTSGNTAVKTDIHIQLEPITQTKCKKLVVSSQFLYGIL